MTASRSGAALMLVGTFVVGALVGGGATLFADHARKGHGPRAGYVERLSSDLGLSPAQRDSIESVLARHQPAMDSLWQLIRPQFQSERQAIRTEISRLLTPEQQAKYLQLQRQDSLRRAEMEKKRNGRH